MSENKKWYQKGIKTALVEMPFHYWIILILIFGFSTIKGIVYEVRNLINPVNNINVVTLKDLEKRIDEIESTTVKVVNATSEVQKAILEIKELARANSNGVLTLKVKVDRNEKDIGKLSE